MAEQNMVSIEKLDEIMNDYFTAVEVVDWHGAELEVKKKIPAAVMYDLVRNVADACFDKETGEYLPEVRDFAERVAIVSAYANVRLPEDDVEHLHDILYRTDLYEVVWKSICSDQLLAISDAIDQRIEARTEANRVAFEYEVQNIIESVRQLGEQINQLFEGITPEDLKAMIAAIGEDGVDEEKIVQAVVAEQNKARGDDNVVPFPVSEETTDGE